MLGGVVDVADTGQLARHPPGVFTLGELRAVTRPPSPAIPPDITAIAAEVRRRGGVSPAWLPAHPALPAGQPCILITVSRAGAAVAGTWTADNAGTAEITGASAIPVGQLTALHIEAPSHRLLLSIPL